MRRSREGRVHQHGRRPERGIEIIVDLLGVEARDRRVRKQRRQHGLARFGKLVEDERGALGFGMDGKKAGSGRRFEHGLSRAQCAASVIR